MPEHVFFNIYDSLQHNLRPPVCRSDFFSASNWAVLPLFWGNGGQICILDLAAIFHVVQEEEDGVRRLGELLS